MENNATRRLRHIIVPLLVGLCSIALLPKSALALGDFGGSSLSAADLGVGAINPYGKALDPSSPSNAMIERQIGIITGQLGIVQGALARDTAMIGLGGYAGNPAIPGMVSSLQGQQDFLHTVLGTRAAIGPGNYGTVGASKLISKAFGGGIPSEDVLGFFTPIGGYPMPPNMRSLMRFTTSAALFSSNLSAGFMFPPAGLGGGLAGGGSMLRAMRMPNVNYRLFGTNVMGRTALNGTVSLRPGLSWADKALTLRHESIHAFLSVGDDAFLASARQQLGIWGYNNSQVLRFTEEALAHGYATRSISQGIMHPLTNPYGISLPGLAGEATLMGGVGYGIYWGLDSLLGL